MSAPLRSAFMLVRDQNPHTVRLQADLLKLAKSLRLDSTPAEEALWQSLRNKQFCKLKFRRQHPLYKYIIDFYCPKLKLIIEIDGPIHQFQLSYDQVRDNFFKQKGYTIIRFSNAEVLYSITKVLNKIEGIINPLLNQERAGRGKYGC